MICITDGILRANADGELNRAESLAVDDHLAGCADCRRRAATLLIRSEQCAALFSGLSPLPGEVPTDALKEMEHFSLLALARLKERWVEAEGAISSLRAPAPPHQSNGHRPGVKAQAAQAGQGAVPLPQERAAAGLSFSIPEPGGLIARLGAAIKQFAADFGQQASHLRSGETGEFRFLLPDETLAARFAREVTAAAIEFKRDPRGFLVELLQGEGGSQLRRRALQAKLAMVLIVYVSLFTTLLFAQYLKHRKAPEAGLKGETSWTVVRLTGTPAVGAKETNGKGEPTSGSKSSLRPSHGGGGGGREQSTPTSIGNIPQASLTHQIMPPNPELPKIKDPSLVVPMTVQVDPRSLPEFKGGPIGDPKGVFGPPSSGPGQGAGIGDGKGTGVGPGTGTGAGPGYGYNTGGGSPEFGGPGGGPVEIAGRNGAGRPVITYREKAKYTEEARQNRVQGTVVLSAIFTADARITGIRVVRGLPDGLTETSIEAAQKIRFRPATKNGVPITVQATIEFTFNLY